MDNVTYSHMAFINKRDGPPKISILRFKRAMSFRTHLAHFTFMLLTNKRGKYKLFR